MPVSFLEKGLLIPESGSRAAWFYPKQKLSTGTCSLQYAHSHWQEPFILLPGFLGLLPVTGITG
jgi:hypothetical protein